MDDGEAAVLPAGCAAAGMDGCTSALFYTDGTKFSLNAGRAQWRADYPRELNFSTLFVALEKGSIKQFAQHWSDASALV